MSDRQTGRWTRWEYEVWLTDTSPNVVEYCVGTAVEVVDGCLFIYNSPGLQGAFAPGHWVAVRRGMLVEE
jgi:hypothetical protein